MTRRLICRDEYMRRVRAADRRSNLRVAIMVGAVLACLDGVMHPTWVPEPWSWMFGVACLALGVLIPVVSMAGAYLRLWSPALVCLHCCGGLLGWAGNVAIETAHCAHCGERLFASED